MARKQVPGLGARIKSTYEGSGLNRHQAAQRLGVAYTTVVNWEKEVSVPDMVNLIDLAELGGVDVHWLATGVGERTRRAGDAAEVEAAVPYPSLLEVMQDQGEAGTPVNDAERAYLEKQRFAEGDPGYRYYLKVLDAYRGRAGVPVRPDPRPNLAEGRALDTGRSLARKPLLETEERAITETRLKDSAPAAPPKKPVRRS